MSENKELFIKNDIIPIVSVFKFIQKCRDKRVSNAFFINNGIEVPKAIVRNKPSFPLFIKSYYGSLSKDIFIVKNNSELTEYHLSNSNLMFMEYIYNLEFDEYTVDTYYDKKK